MIPESTIFNFNQPGYPGRRQCIATKLQLCNDILKLSFNADEISIAHALWPGKMPPS